MGRDETRRPVAEFVEMLKREPELDRSIPLEDQAVALLHDVMARCERAVTTLRIEGLGLVVGGRRHAHLQSKMEGVQLAISYMEDELRLSRMARRIDRAKEVGSEQTVAACNALDAEHHEPKRGDEVEAWIKRRRDEQGKDDCGWLVYDDMLDSYRLHADTGTPLGEDADHPGRPAS